jgi:hypothetical protein
MNATHQTACRRVPTRFARPTRFKVRPTAAPAVRAALNARLERLKDRLLAPHVNAPDDLTPFLRRAAEEAASLAWTTPYPLFILPELLEEKVAAARLHAARQASVLRRSQALLAEAA